MNATGQSEAEDLANFVMKASIVAGVVIRNITRREGTLRRTVVVTTDKKIVVFGVKEMMGMTIEELAGRLK